MNNYRLKKFAYDLAALPERVMERLRPIEPETWMNAQARSLDELLPFEAMLTLERPTMLLSDGSLGVTWKISPIEHEVLSNDELKAKLTRLVEVFEKSRNERLSFQVIFDSEPSDDFDLPHWLNEDGSNAERLLTHRIKEVKKLSKEKLHKLVLMKRTVLLTARLQPKKEVKVDNLLCSRIDQEIVDAAASFEELSREIKHIGEEVEFSLTHAGIKYATVSGKDFLAYLRNMTHSMNDRGTLDYLKNVEEPTEARFAKQVARGFVTTEPNAISVGDDTWEVASWVDKPEKNFTGLFAYLLQLDVPHKLVVNISPVKSTSDLDTKSSFLRHATNSFSELQRDEVKEAQDRIARGEAFFSTSIHLLVRNVNVTTKAVKIESTAKKIVSKLHSFTQLPFVIEQTAAVPIFLFCLPLGYTRQAANLSGRNLRLSANALKDFLPVFAGFQGTKTPMQLMVSRAGNAVWLNPFDSETSPHVGILASSGGGKSFYLQNLAMSFFAKEKKQPGKKGGLCFIIDKKTSYEIFARVIGEDVGAQIVKPPENFPNIFRGKLDEFRLPVIVGILKTAMSLVSPKADISAVEEMVLSQAVTIAFEQNELDAGTEYREGGFHKVSITKVRIPRLTDVVDMLVPVCAKSGTPSSVGENLATLLSPFMGNGPYAALFDKEEFDSLDPETPGISLYDVDAVSGNQILSTLTTQVILSEILRQIRRPENKGRPGLLVIEEVGVLSGESPAIVQFIADAWKTFRKLGFCCIGLTNEVDDFAKKPGPREIWNVSPNKVILKMLDKDIQKALSGDLKSGFPPLIEDEYFGKLISSLSKIDGSYSQGFWWSNETKGTFVYAPTAFDYFCAASKPIEVATVYKVKEVLNSNYFDAVAFLAKHFPQGVRTQDGSLRELSSEEILSIRGQQ